MTHLQLSDLVAIVALVAAGAAYVRVRRLAVKVRALNDAYWELRYLHAELRAQVARSGRAAVPPEGGSAPVSPRADGFIPLQSLKR